MVQAVLAIEDRRFYDHPGVDIIRTIGAVITNLRGDRQYLVGGSTITQQLVKNFFLTPEKSLKRKLAEQYMAIILERKASKDEILEMYLNEVYLGQRGSFAVHGVAEAARLFFGKDVSNLSLGEAATIAGVIQSPYYLVAVRVARALDASGATSCCARWPTRDSSRRRPPSAADAEPIEVVRRALDAQAPYFVDFVGQTLGEQYPGLTATTRIARRLHDARHPPAAHRAGRAARRPGARRRAARQEEARRSSRRRALIAVDPRTGEVLALVGGRSYNQSQFNRARQRRAPARVGVQAVRLPGGVRARRGREADTRPHARPTSRGGSTRRRRSTTTGATIADWTPSNYENEYDGIITLRRALALSRNIGDDQGGRDRPASTRSRRCGARSASAPTRTRYPSITLGVFEATPYEIATAYTLFPNGGQTAPAARALARRRAAARPTVAAGSAARRRSRAPTRRTSSPT